MSEPRTAAGRALLERYDPARHYTKGKWAETAQDFRDAILAIEAQARPAVASEGLRPARRGGHRHLTFDNQRSEDYEAVFVQHHAGGSLLPPPRGPPALSWPLNSPPPPRREAAWGRWTWSGWRGHGRYRRMNGLTET